MPETPPPAANSAPGEKSPPPPAAPGASPAPGANPEASGKPVLLAQGVQVRFADVQVLADLDFSLSPGEQVAVTGPSGSGKTTLLQILSGLSFPSGGTVRMMGVDLRLLDEPELARMRNLHLGFVYQQSHLLPGFSCLDNAAIPLLLRGESLSRAREIAFAELEGLGLASVSTRSAAALSGGERQRAALARALVGSPRALLLDEPTAGLDTRTAAETGDWLQQRLQGGGTSLMLATHDLNLARRLPLVRELQGGRWAS